MKGNGRLKIVVLGTRGFPEVQGGVESHCQNLYPLLAERGCQVTVFSRRPYIGSRSYKGVELVSLPCPKNKFLEAFLHTFLGIFAARKLKPDILHIQAIGPSFFAPLAKLLGFKVVMTHHGPDYQRRKWGRLAKAFLKQAEGLGIRYSDRIIAISDYITSSCANGNRDKFTTIPNGVKPKKARRTSSILKKHCLKKNRYILTVGRFVPEKGFLDLIDAFDKLQSQNPRIKKGGWKLAIVGRADHRSRYSQEITDKAKKNKDIVLTGYISGAPLEEIFAHAGIFALPSHYEGLPIALLEALSYGLSCVVSNIPANRHLGLSSERFFPAGNARALKGKLVHFSRYSMSGNERRSLISLVAKKYDWENIADKTKEVYTSLSARQ